MSTLQDRRAALTAEITTLEREQGAAVLDGKPFDAKPLIAAREALEALDTAEAEQSRAYGVGQVLIIGGRKRQFNVSVDPVKLKSLGLTASDVGTRGSLTYSGMDTHPASVGSGPCDRA